MTAVAGETSYLVGHAAARALDRISELSGQLADLDRGRSELSAERARLMRNAKQLGASAREISTASGLATPTVYAMVQASSKGDDLSGIVTSRGSYMVMTTARDQSPLGDAISAFFADSDGIASAGSAQIICNATYGYDPRGYAMVVTDSLASAIAIRRALIAGMIELQR